MASRTLRSEEDSATATTVDGRAASVVEDMESETLDGAVATGAGPRDDLGRAAAGPHRGGEMKDMSGGSWKDQDTTGKTGGPGRFGTGISED
jgi:hypothetical protein